MSNFGANPYGENIYGGPAVWADSVSEAATASDSPNVQLAAVTAVNETATATDNSQVQLIAVASVNEAASAVDKPSSDSINEAVAATDASSIQLDAVATLSEAVISGDNSHSVLIANPSVSEGNGFSTDAYGNGPYGQSPTRLIDTETVQLIANVTVTEGPLVDGNGPYGEGFYGAGPYGESVVTPPVRDTEDATVSGTRTFIIAGIQQKPIAAGIIVLPTSEDISLGPQPYIVGSSPLYTVGQVYWDGVLKTEGVDWEFVSPFNHIIQILDPATVHSDIRLIYFRWDIGVRAGFKVNLYPVPFSFTGTSLIAERVPPPNQFFTLEYTSIRPGTNPVTMFARYPEIVDDILSTHTLYDGSSGFETYRPAGYKVFDQSNSTIYAWNGTAWNSQGQFPDRTKFYVKRLRQIWLVNAGALVLQYTAGDGPDPSIPEVLTYPPFGESIGKNFAADAFLPSASVDYPSAYVIGQRPGTYDEWVTG